MFHQEMGAENKERLLKAICYRSGGKTRGLDVEERREGKYLKTTCLLPWEVWLKRSQRMTPVFGASGEEGWRRKSP